jgi:hypothetical protein
MISRHKNDRQPQSQFDDNPLFYRDQNTIFQAHCLLSRQHAFLRLLTSKSQLALHMKSFTWILVWTKNELFGLTDTDRLTWSVFSKLVNVTHLNLSSVHHIDDEDYVRQNPAILFPKVIDLRLHGWMHRGLVRTILTSLDPTKLGSLKMDFLIDEGALPDGKVTYGAFASHFLRGQNEESAHRLESGVLGISDIIHDDLIERQESGKAYIFPGPMWIPLHYLSVHALDSLVDLRIKVPNYSIDQRNFHTSCEKLAAFIVKISLTLKWLVVVYEERRQIFDRNVSPQVPGGRRLAANRLWHLRTAKLFLEQQLVALNNNSLPWLEVVRFEGFYIFLDASPEEAARTGIASVFQLIRECPFANASFVEISSMEDGICFLGHQRKIMESGEQPEHSDDDGGYAELLASS